MTDLRDRLDTVLEAPIDDAGDHSPRAIYRRMSDVEPRRIEALWPGYLVRRKLNVMAGLGGVGKDQLGAHLVARGSRGLPMPSCDQGEVIRTLILSAEDDAHEDWRPRLDANGADLDNVLILDGVREAGDGDLRWVDVRHHMPIIEDVIRREGIGLIYVSPLSAYMPGTSRRDAGEVRDTLGFLQRLIDVSGVTILGTLHLNKDASQRGALRVLDSVEFTNTARCVLGVADLPDDLQPAEVLDDPTRGRRKTVSVLKSNSMIPGPDLCFSRPLDAALVWHGAAPLGFDDALAHRPDMGGDGKLGDATEWLHDRLTGGAVEATTVKREAADAGIAAATLRRAKTVLQIATMKERGPGGAWVWRLPPGPVEDAHSPTLSVLSTFPEGRDDDMTVAHPQGVQDVQGAQDSRVGIFDLERKPPGGIWTCTGCRLPRSTGPGPCPACGTTAGRWFVPQREGANDAA